MSPLLRWLTCSRESKRPSSQQACGSQFLGHGDVLLVVLMRMPSACHRLLDHSAAATELILLPSSVSPLSFLSSSTTSVAAPTDFAPDMHHVFSSSRVHRTR